ncbi:hypothetical protein D3C78_974910 [compost metagenome]
MQGARLTGGNRVARLIEDAHLVVRAHGAALGVNDLLVGVAQPGVVDQPLRHAEHLLQPAAEQRPNLAGHRLPQLGAAHLQQVEALELSARSGIRFRGLQPERDRRRHQRGEVDPVAGDQRETADGAGIGGEHHGAARLEYPQGARGAQGEVVGRRQSAQIAGMGAKTTELNAAAHAVVIVVMSTWDKLGGACAAAGELEEGHLVRRGQATFHRLTLSPLRQPTGQPQLPPIAIQQHQPGADGYQQLALATLVRKQRMGQRTDKEARSDLLGIREELQPVVAKERIDRRDAGFEQGEEHQIELGHVGELHQRGIPHPQAMAGQIRSQLARGGVQLAIAEAALAAEDGLCVGGQLALTCQHGGQGLAAPIALGAVALGQLFGPAGIGQETSGLAHCATSKSRPRAFNMVPSLVPVSAHSMAGSEPATIPAPANSST